MYFLVTTYPSHLILWDLIIVVICNSFYNFVNWSLNFLMQKSPIPCSLCFFFFLSHIAGVFDSLRLVAPVHNSWTYYSFADSRLGTPALMLRSWSLSYSFPDFCIFIRVSVDWGTYLIKAVSSICNIVWVFLLFCTPHILFIFGLFLVFY